MADTGAWDAEDFEPELPDRQGSDDKWDGEDADDGVKGNWEDSDDQDTSNNKQEAESQAYQRPKKKPIAERLAEKEAQTKKEEEEKVKQKEEKKKSMTVEERQAEKERLRKQKEQESLSLARGLFEEGEKEKPTAEEEKEKPTKVISSVDEMTPLSEPEFEQFGEALKSKIQYFEDSEHYRDFVVQLINDLSLTLCAEEVKKLGISVNSVYHQKERLRKETEKEKKKKKKSKVSIKVDRADDLDLIGDANSGSYFDDGDFL